MMKKFRLLYLCICLFGCQMEKKPHEADNKTLTTIHIELNKKNTSEDFLKLVEDVRFVPLETTNENVMGESTKIWVTDSLYYMLVFSAMNYQLHIYTHDGHFVLKKEAEGKGKNEINDLRDFCLGEDNTFYLLGYREYYHYNDKGDLLAVSPLKTPYENFNPTQFYISADSCMLMFNSSMRPQTPPEKEKYCMFSYNFKQKTWQNVLKRHTATVSDNVIIQSNSSILINPVMGIDTIYTWADGRFKPLYYIDFGDNKIKIDELPADYSSPLAVMGYARNNKKCFHILNVAKDDNWLRFFFFCRDSYSNVWHNLNSGKTYLFNPKEEDIKHILLFSRPVGVCNNEFVYNISAHKILDFLQSNSLDFKFLSEARHQEIIDQLKQVKETDNPVLMFVKMKPE